MTTSNSSPFSGISNVTIVYNPTTGSSETKYVDEQGVQYVTWTSTSSSSPRPPSVTESVVVDSGLDPERPMSIEEDLYGKW